MLKRYHRMQKQPGTGIGQNDRNTCEKMKFLLLIRVGPPLFRTAAVAEWYRYRIVACLVASSSPVPLKTRHVGQRCTLNLSRAETSSRSCGVVVRREVASSGVVHVTRPWFKITCSVAKSHRVAEQCDVNIQSINQPPLFSMTACFRHRIGK
ncbi:uncharacterized protein TNCV_262571 [Trichonephila clavipes]|nr:uncharacterized protein TNCV_262571 [Trichonephila clavipes]